MCVRQRSRTGQRTGITGQCAAVTLVRLAAAIVSCTEGVSAAACSYAPASASGSWPALAQQAGVTWYTDQSCMAICMTSSTQPLGSTQLAWLCVVCAAGTAQLAFPWIARCIGTGAWHRHQARPPPHEPLANVLHASPRLCAQEMTAGSECNALHVECQGVSRTIARSAKEYQER